MDAAKRPRPRTWSLLGEVKRRPTQYEVLTSRFHYHFRRDPAPFELSPGAPINQWFLRHCEGSPFQVEDWEQFRDPYSLTYRDYVAQQHDREVHVDLLIDRHEAAGSLELQPEWVHTLRRLVVPMRFPLHVLQMSGSYVSQMAPSSFITNCATFQAADEMRRIHRLAYWTKALSLVHGDYIAATGTARNTWEADAAWQPARRALERLLAVRDWGECFVALNLVLKPAFDVLLNDRFGALALDNGDRFIADLCTEFQHDSQRSREWSAALIRYALERRPSVKRTIRSWVAHWQPQADEAVEALAGIFGLAPIAAAPDHIVDGVLREIDAYQRACEI
jgi:toluene monooxygenase system protein E